jgi:tetratricopeptide (TPR) repeat protein
MRLIRTVVFICFASLVAIDACAHGDLHDRITNLTAQITIAPTNAALYFERGELYRLHRDFPEALADFHRAQGLNPRLPMIEFCLGNTLFDAGELKTALVHLTHYLTKATNDAGAFAVRARVQAQIGNHRAAAEDFTRAIQIAPTGSPEFYIERAEALTADGAKEEALRGLEDGIRKIGPLVTFQTQAADLEVALRRYDAALKRVDTVMARMQRKEGWLVRRAEILKLAGREKESKAAYRDALAALDRLPNSQRYTRAMIQLEASIRSALKE